MKKRVIAYLHTHWDREWYREFEAFRLRLLRVFDNVLEMLEAGKIPSFYFDGQVAALLDYLEIRPEKEALVRRLVSEKKLFIGPFYTLVDEFLTDRTCFSKNLETGMKIARDFGCEDFIGYLADTFGHSQNVPAILLEHGVDKCMVWRGVPAEVPAEFTFNGINTVNMLRGYFMDIFSAPLTIEEKAAQLAQNLDKIAEKSGDTLLLPIGADHLGVEPDIAEQITAVKELLDDYEIVLSSPFEYFRLVEGNFAQLAVHGELRDNSTTFILPGSYSARLDLKRYNVECMYKLEKADEILRRRHYEGVTTEESHQAQNDAIIEYAYKLLLQNQAHDGICGCSTDLVHRENIMRYEKVLQIANEINNVPQYYSDEGKAQGFERELLNDTQRIPVTEDWKTFHLQPPCCCPATLPPNVEFVRYKDEGDAYNFGAVKDDKGTIIRLEDFAGAQITKLDDLTHFRLDLSNTPPNTLQQVKFNLPEPVVQTFSEDMNTLIERRFDPEYDIRAGLPLGARGLEAKTNTAPMQRFVWAQGFGALTKGLTEYEVRGNSLLITLSRTFGVISNPRNPCRTTPAGPPIPVFDAQKAGIAEFAIGFFDKEDYLIYVDKFFSQTS